MTVDFLNKIIRSRVRRGYRHAPKASTGSAARRQLRHWPDYDAHEPSIADRIADLVNGRAAMRIHEERKKVHAQAPPLT